MDTRGELVNGFDYDLQTWVKGYIIQKCGHPAPDRNGFFCTCNARKYAGHDIRAIKKQLSQATNPEPEPAGFVCVCENCGDISREDQPVNLCGPCAAVAGRERIK